MKKNVKRPAVVDVVNNAKKIIDTGFFYQEDGYQECTVRYIGHKLAWEEEDARELGCKQLMIEMLKNEMGMLNVEIRSYEDGIDEVAKSLAHIFHMKVLAFTKTIEAKRNEDGSITVSTPEGCCNSVK